MGAGTSPADPAAAADRALPVPPGAGARGAGRGARVPDAPGEGVAAAVEGPRAEGKDVRGHAAEGPDAERADAEAAEAADAGTTARGSDGSDPAPGGGPQARPSRRFPSFTRDTARPEGGGRAASGDAPAPARQWPLLAVLCTAGIGLLIVAVNPFAEAFRIGTILIGVALIGGAVLRCTVASVGMLAVRSRFTDLVTYGLLGVLIVLLALVAQPKPWLDVPFLEHAVRFTIR